MSPENDMLDAAQAYAEAYGDTPTIMGLPGRVVEKAARLLRDAVENNDPFETDADWFEALGIEPPPKDALT